ncbi:hypothetical protein [Fischerella thermalis]|uniref:hypothetical protein n=2 Tax=Fischerella thermalis TaxID=372787 RepID=UPI0011AEDB6E|nr:hypothetical protein [Fischerella thermalis]
MLFLQLGQVKQASPGILEQQQRQPQHPSPESPFAAFDELFVHLLTPRREVPHHWVAFPPDQVHQLRNPSNVQGR